MDVFFFFEILNFKLLDRCAFTDHLLKKIYFDIGIYKTEIDFSMKYFEKQKIYV